jgi:isochorismate hydrolase
MANANTPKRALIEGKAALIVIDIQASTFIDDSVVRSIDNMTGYKERMLEARTAIDGARAAGIPVIFIQEVHRPDLIDFGRELDGDEDVHCLEDNPKTALAVKEMGILPTDYVVPKRRYSAFFGTERPQGGNVDPCGWADGCVRSLHIRGCTSAGLLYPRDRRLRRGVKSRGA